MPLNEAVDQLNFGIDAGARAPARCAACQLQLCKSRTEPPHAALKEIGRDEAEQATRYSCQTCGAVLVRTSDYARPGWSHRR